jgi:hypothetical protein
MTSKLPILWVTVPRRPDRAAFFQSRNIARFPQLRWIRVNGFDPIWHQFRSIRNSETDGHAACWMTTCGRY